MGEDNLDMVMIMELLQLLVKVVMEQAHLLQTTTLHLQVLLDQEVMVLVMVVVKVAMALVATIMPHHVEVLLLGVEDVTGIERPSTSFYNVLAKLRNCGLVQFIGLICGPKIESSAGLIRTLDIALWPWPSSSCWTLRKLDIDPKWSCCLGLLQCYEEMII